jgi:hypothetical protein
MEIMGKVKEPSLKERVEELEAEVRWLKHLLDRHIYTPTSNPAWFYMDFYLKPGPTTGG